MDKEKIDRINLLSRKSRTEGLTDAEKAEQAMLRSEYIDAIKSNLRKTLNNTVIINDDNKNCH